MADSHRAPFGEGLSSEELAELESSSLSHSTAPGLPAVVQPTYHCTTQDMNTTTRNIGSELSAAGFRSPYGAGAHTSTPARP